MCSARNPRLETKTHKARATALDSSGASVVVQTKPEIGVDGADKLPPHTSSPSSKPVSAIIHDPLGPPARIKHPAGRRKKWRRGAVVERAGGGRGGLGWGMRMGTAVSSLHRRRHLFFSYFALTLSPPSPFLALHLERAASPVCISAGVVLLWRLHFRGASPSPLWGLRPAILTRARARSPAEAAVETAGMMARRMGASLIAVLPKVPGSEVLEKVMGYVRGTFGADASFDAAGGGAAADVTGGGGRVVVLPRFPFFVGAALCPRLDSVSIFGVYGWIFEIRSKGRG
ncbi:hypothetical protein C8R45DRAFT_1073587 [Mycena sanguinolenta]|nr:hypothetical protein C8R45DRAFT_1073587 [Mycena sanguinolenta]